MNGNTVDSPEQQTDQQIAAICTENAADCSPLQRNARSRSDIRDAENALCTEGARPSARIEPHEFDDMLRRAWEVLDARARIERQGRLGA